MKINPLHLTLGEAAFFEKSANMTLTRFFTAFADGDIHAAPLAAFVTLIKRRTGHPDYSLETARTLEYSEALEYVQAHVEADPAEEDPES